MCRRLKWGDDKLLFVLTKLWNDAEIGFFHAGPLYCQSPRETDKSYGRPQEGQSLTQSAIDICNSWIKDWSVIDNTEFIYRGTLDNHKN
jgi:hypothetical protein